MTQYVSQALRELADIDEYGRTLPLAVYARYPGKTDTVSRNLTVEQAESLAEAYAVHGYRVHVSLDVCG